MSRTMLYAYAGPVRTMPLADTRTEPEWVDTFGPFLLKVTCLSSGCYAWDVSTDDTTESAVVDTRDEAITAAHEVAIDWAESLAAEIKASLARHEGEAAR